MPSCHSCVPECRPTCLNAGLHAWMPPCMLGRRPACLDTAMHAWIPPCMLGCRIACLHALLHASIRLFTFRNQYPCFDPPIHPRAPPCAVGSAETRQKALNKQCATCHNKGSNTSFRAYRAGALSTGPQWLKEKFLLFSEVEMTFCSSMRERAISAATHSAT